MRIPSRHHRWRALTLAAVLLLTACGAGDATATEESSSVTSGGSAGNGEDAADLSPREAAEQNTPLLQTPDNVRDVEVLSVTDGSITTLRETVEGDRAVLLWFWAPH